MNKVKIASDKNGNIITVSPNNPEYGWIIVEQLTHQLEGGWLKPVLRKARITGKMEDLLNIDYKAGQELSGQIIVLESLTPFDNETPDRDLKIAGKTGVICRYFDQPIYRQCYYTSNPNSQDELINHTNKDEIREVMLAQKMLSELPTEEPAL